MNGKNKLITITLDLSYNNIRDEGARSLSLALMNKSNKVTTLDISNNNFGTTGLAALLKSVRVSVVGQLNISQQERLHPELRLQVAEVTSAFSDSLPRLVCLASVRTIPRIGDQGHFRMLSSDILIRAAQTLGWFIDLKGTIRMLEKNND